MVRPRPFIFSSKKYGSTKSFSMYDRPDFWHELLTDQRLQNEWLRPSNKITTGPILSYMKDHIGDRRMKKS